MGMSNRLIRMGRLNKSSPRSRMSCESVFSFWKSIICILVELVDLDSGVLDNSLSVRNTQ